MARTRARVWPWEELITGKREAFQGCRYVEKSAFDEIVDKWFQSTQSKASLESENERLKKAIEVFVKDSERAQELFFLEVGKLRQENAQLKTELDKTCLVIRSERNQALNALLEARQALADIRALTPDALTYGPRRAAQALADTEKAGAL